MDEISYSKKKGYIPRVRPGIDPEFQRDLRGAYERLNEMAAQVARNLAELEKLANSYDFDLIRRNLSAGGPNPLSVEGLLGVLAQPQISGAPVVSALPSPDSPQSQDGALVTFNGAIYVYNESTRTWNSGTGSVVSVGTSTAGSAAGFLLSGGPITTTGTVSFSISSPATARTSLGVDPIAACKSNLSAAVAPTATDDSTAGYSIGSQWLDTTADDAYVCLDATATAAVWKKTTP